MSARRHKIERFVQQGKQIVNTSTQEIIKKTLDIYDEKKRRKFLVAPSDRGVIEWEGKTD